MKKLLPYILVGVVVIGVFGPIGVKITHAGLFSWLTGSLIDVSYAVVAKALAFVGNIILWMVSRLLWIAAHLFDYTLKITLDNGALGNISAVNDGWMVCRDVANLFFIFILLYIAIATILQLSSYNMKALLVRLVIIALLVNFSLVITKVIIDASNILALEFYNRIGVRQSDGTIERDITGVMMKGLKLQSIYTSNELEDMETAGQAATEKYPSISSVIIGTIFGSILILVTTFVFLAATVLFVIRTIVLLFLMILAPLAFLFMVLPKTQQYASQWWDTLFKQSFFAPAFMFMIYLVMKMIAQRDLYQVIGGATGKSGDDAVGAISGAMTGNDPGALGVLVNFIILIGLMIGSLIVAQKLGAVGAGAVQSWGKGAAKWGRGYAGRTARRAAAPVAEAFATGEGKGRVTRAAAALGRGVRKVPLVGGVVTRGAAGIGVASRARLAEIQKGYENYSDKELKNMMSRLTPFNRTAVIQELAKRGNLKIEKDESGRPTTALNDERIKESMKIIKRYSGDTKPINQLRPDLVEDKEEREKALKFANWEKMDKDTIGKIFADEKMKQEVIENCSSAVARKVLDVGGKAEDDFFGSLTKLGERVEEIAGKLEEAGNRSLAGWVRGGLGAQQILIAHGMPAPKEKEEKPKLYGPTGKLIT